MPIISGNTIVNTTVANSTVTVDQTQSWLYATSNRNSIRPSLVLDFARSQTVDPRITFTRASSATYFNSLGVLSTATNNVPRIDYDPVTGACLGLLIEQASTNLIRNNTMVGAVAYATIASQTISSITFSGTTATVTTSSPHGLGAYSAGVIITGASPSDYNGTFLITTVPNSTSFSYVMRTTPATNATVVGSYTAKNTGTFPTYWANFASNIPYGVVGSGTINGISYIDVRYYGLPNAALGLYSVMCMDYTVTVGIPVTGGSSYTEGFYCAIVGGSTAGITAIYIDNRYFGGNGALQDYNILPSLTSTLTRFSSTTTAQSTATGTFPSYLITYTDNVAVDITLRFGMPQFEASAFPTSIITTSGATATRAVETCIYTPSVAFPTSGTLLTEYLLTSTEAAGGPFRDVSAIGSDSSNIIVARTGTSNTIQIADFVSNVLSMIYSSLVSAPVNQTNKFALTYSSSLTSTLSVNGGTIASGTASAFPTMSNIYLSTNRSGQINGYYRKISFYPVVLSNTEITTLTTL